MRLFKQEIKRAVLSYRFWLSTLAYALLLCLSTDLNSSTGAMYQFNHVLTSGFYMMFLVCATAPFSDSFIIDIKTRFIYSILSRSKRQCYLYAKVIVTVLSGIVCVALSLIILMVYLVAFFPIQEDGSMPYDGYAILITARRFGMYFFTRTCITCMIGGVFSAFALMCSTVLKSSLATIVSSIVAFYLYNEFINFGIIPEFLNITQMLYTPLSFFDTLLASFLYTVIFSIIVILLCGKCFLYFAERRLENV